MDNITKDTIKYMINCFLDASFQIVSPALLAERLLEKNSANAENKINKTIKEDPTDSMISMDIIPSILTSDRKPSNNDFKIKANNNK